MIRGIVTICAALLLAPLLVACQGGQILPGKSVFAPGKPGKMTVKVKGLEDMGRKGDTELAHVTPAEKRMLKEKGGSGTTNPKTGLKEFFHGGGGSAGGGFGQGAGAGGAASSAGSQTGGNRGGGDRDNRGGNVRIERRKKAKTFRDEETGETFTPKVTIERRKKATTFKDLSPDADQRDGALILNISTQSSDGGELGGESSTKPGKKDDKRRGSRAAAILGAGAGSEGIRDKLGRSGRRGPGKSLG